MNPTSLSHLPCAWACVHSRSLKPAQISHQRNTLRPFCLAFPSSPCLARRPSQCSAAPKPPAASSPIPCPPSVLPRPPIASSLTTANVDASLLSPMMRNYVATKQHLSHTLGSPPAREVVLLYRVGDFFECFFEDARLLAATCDLMLTSKEAGKALGARVPMAGVPHHAVDPKIRALLAAGITVAVVDQMQTAAERPTGGLVRRAITRLITPGTASDEALLDAKRSSYVAAVAVRGGRIEGIRFGFAFADVSTGEFRVTDGEGLDALQRVLVNVAPAEVLVVAGRGFAEVYDAVVEEVRRAGVGVVTRRDSLGSDEAERVVKAFSGVDDVESVGCRGRPLCVEAAASLAAFTQETLAIDKEQERPLPLSPLRTFAMSDVMLLDASCLRNMEIVETTRDGGRERSLQWAVDRTVTGMGARCLRAWLLAPSMSLDVIAKRHVVVEALVEDRQNVRVDLQRELSGVADLERLSGKVGAGRATPRELRVLVESVLRLPTIFDLMDKCFSARSSSKSPDDFHAGYGSTVDAGLILLASEIEQALVDPAPSTLVSELFVRGGAVSKENWNVSSTQIFRSGYNERLDALKSQVEDPTQWITLLEEREKQRTKMDSLRIRHIKNTGYVLRIPRMAGEKIMDDDPMFFAKLGYERVQSTKAELRFRFEALKGHERDHNSAFSDVVLLELKLYGELRDRLAKYVQHLRDLAKQIAALDVLSGFAQLAEEQRYVRPALLGAEERVLELSDARHPVVEQSLPVGKTFVPNSFVLGAGSGRPYPDVMILCGPNAAGKSCALRSIGLICILAQIGCFVPATAAKLSLCDRIFTRVGAVDDLARGQSTFQVEMAETACILSHSTSSSLILLDEIGRGTSAVDGIAIAWSVSEYLAAKRNENEVERNPARTMFVTHYHELNQLASLHHNIQSFQLHMEEREVMDNGKERRVEWVTTHKVVPGASFQSLGLAIARRAGFPISVMKRAEEIALLLQEPSKVLGAELRQALSPDALNWNVQRVESQKFLQVDRSCDQSEEESARYADGFEKGYAKAKAELCRDLREEFARLEVKYACDG